MAQSEQEFFDLYYKQGESEKNKEKEKLKEAAESDKKIINANADNSLQSIRDGYNADVADVNESYEDAFRKNEVQVKLNERYLERKAAEMGLTDSGLNRTQMTANQLSYANQNGELTRQRQKAIDTIAAAMRAKITEVELGRNNSIAQVDSTLNSNLAKIDSDHASSVRQQAVDTYNTQYKADKEAETALTKAEQEAINARNSQRTPKYEKLLIDIYSEDLSPEQKINTIETFGLVYGFETIEQANDILKRAGLDEDYEYVLKEDGKGYLEKRKNLKEIFLKNRVIGLKNFGTRIHSIKE